MVHIMMQIQSMQKTFFKTVVMKHCMHQRIHNIPNRQSNREWRRMKTKYQPDNNI